MNKLFASVLILVCLLSFAACTPDEEINISAADTVKTEKTENQTQIFPAQYIRTDGYVEGRDYPYTVNISSASELENYIEENGETYFLGHRNAPASDSTIGFSDATEKYDNYFFEENMLVMVILEEGSGSIRHELMGVTKDNIILIKRITPEAYTCDMAEWHIIIEMPRGRAEGVNFEAEYYGEDNREFVSFAHNFIIMNARLPKGWSYNEVPLDIAPETDHKSVYDIAKSNMLYCGLEFFPENDPEVQLKLYYWAKFPGVCGTFLSVSETTLGGHSVTLHTYDGRKSFSRCFFKDVAGDYVLELIGGDDAYEKYESDILALIESFEIGPEESVNRDTAILLAKEYCTIDYTLVSADFDFVRGVWKVNFSCGYDENGYAVVGGDQTVVLYNNGKFLESIYGE
ncbi:MAG: hypothetical protein IKT56_00630 [Clostridia bacterium]|nr:hypothetical protein [Clostridia bacterium]